MRSELNMLTLQVSRSGSRHRKRLRLELELEVLSVVKDREEKPTRIVYAANLSWPFARSVLDSILSPHSPFIQVSL